MTPLLLAALTPHLSVFTQGDPDPAIADPVVRRALAASGSTQPANVVPGAAPPDETLVRIVVTAEDAAGHRFRRRAIVLTGQGGTGGEGDRPFHVLAWDAPAT